MKLTKRREEKKNDSGDMRTKMEGRQSDLAEGVGREGGGRGEEGGAEGEGGGEVRKD